MSEFLVTGATGKTGERVVDRLAAAGHAVRAGSRHPGPERPGVRPTLFDWDDPSGHDAALDGVDAVYIVQPALRVDAVDVVSGFVDRIGGSAGTRAVLLSARGVDADEGIPMRRVELHLEASAVAATILRPTWFAQNFTEGVFADGVRAGVVAAPTGDGPEPFIDVDDIADVAVAALTDDAHADATYELSGPEAITFARAAEVLSSVAGRPVRHEDVDPDAWRDAAVGAGLPADYAALLGGLFDVIRQGLDAPVSDGVELALGRPARGFEDWAATVTLAPV